MGAGSAYAPLLVDGPSPAMRALLNLGDGFIMGSDSHEAKGAHDGITRSSARTLTLTCCDGSIIDARMDGMPSYQCSQFGP
jgi:hypothetical protein